MESNPIISIYVNAIVLYRFYNFSTHEILQYCWFLKIYLIIRILNVFSQIMTTLKAKATKIYQARFIFVQAFEFLSLRHLKSRRIVDYHIIFLLLRLYTIESSIHIEDSIYQSSWIGPNFVCNLTSPIDLAPDRIPLGAKLIGKV